MADSVVDETKPEQKASTLLEEKENQEIKKEEREEEIKKEEREEEKEREEKEEKKEEIIPKVIEDSDLDSDSDSEQGACGGDDYFSRAWAGAIGDAEPIDTDGDLYPEYVGERDEFLEVNLI